MTDPCPNCRDLSDKASEYKHAFAKALRERDEARQLVYHAMMFRFSGDVVVRLSAEDFHYWQTWRGDSLILTGTRDECIAEAKRLAGLE